DATKLSGRPLRFLQQYGYPGKIYPVNPRYEKVAGLRCYPSLAAVPDEIDLAVIALPAAAVPGAIKECAAKGVKAATVFSAGFAEVGEEGAKLQAEVRQAALEGGVALDGPNCAGLLGVRERAMATFNTAMERGAPLEGPVAFVSQSGALGTYMFAAAQDAGVGFNYWVSTGNEAVLGFADYVEYFVAEESTRAIMAYMEDARDGEALKACALKALEAGKPLIILKVGTSEAGARAATSHTGALAGSDRVYDAVFAQHGIIRAHDVEDLFDLATICMAERRPKGRGTALMTISGGAGILMCDRCEEVGLKVATLAAETVEALRQVLPPFASAVNPVDVTAELVARPGLLRRSMEIVLADPAVDSLIIFLGLQLGTGAGLARDIAEVARTTEKMILVNWMAPPPEALAILRENKIPVFPDPARGVRALAGLVQYVERRQRYLAQKAAGKETSRQPVRDQERQAKAREIIQKARQQGRKALTEPEAKAVLDLYGIPTPRRRLAQDAAAAAQEAEELGFPLVMKIASPDITHKTEAGGVRLGIRDAGEAAKVYEEVMTRARAHYPGATLDGVLLEEMVEDGVEVIVGAKQDPRFGPAVTFGLGGIFVELLRDFSLRVAPLDEEEVLAMIKEIKGYPLLSGYRGEKPRDVAALAKAILAVGELASELQEELAELDINPL
ncbi:MAG: acetate--CoA ligase family protein, partial [Clostridia bacterium]|nr:acetate--CoA ligase family protein [Clostridia bacterium]